MSTTAHTAHNASDPAFPYPAIAAILLSEERAAVAALPPAGVQNWALAQVEDVRRRMKELERQIARLNEVHNAMLPIHRLPPEVFGMVLAEVCQSFQYRRLERVCRRWRAALLSAHHIWAAALAKQEFIYPGKELQIPGVEDEIDDAGRAQARKDLAWGLDHTGLMLLHLRIFLYAGRFSSILSAHASRLHTLEVMMYPRPRQSVVRELCKLLCLDLPNLTTLIFDPMLDRVGVRQRNREPVPGERKLPRLRHLTLPSRPDLIFLEPPRGLETLNASSLGPSLGILLDYLRASSNTLTHLSLLVARWDERTVSGPRRKIHLPCLKRLVVPGISESFHVVFDWLKFDLSTCVVEIMSYTKFTLESILPPSFPGYHTAPLFDRLVLDHVPLQVRPRNSSAVWNMKLLTSCYYVQGTERLRVARTEHTVKGTFEPSLQDVPILELAVLQSFTPSGFEDREVRQAADPKMVMRHLPHLRRLELLDPNVSRMKCKYARCFLQRYGDPTPREPGPAIEGAGAENEPKERHPADQRSTSEGAQLTLVWLLALNRDSEAICGELEAIVDMLATYAAERGARWPGTLELYGTLDSQSVFVSCAGIPTRPEACAGVVEPFMSLLRDLVGEVLIA